MPCPFRTGLTNPRLVEDRETPAALREEGSEERGSYNDEAANVVPNVK